jgi:ATP-dependent Clp protease protease subunit
MRHLTKEHTLEDIERLMERDKFLSAQEALEMGIVDEILVRRAKDEGKEGKDGVKVESGT